VKRRRDSLIRAIKATNPSPARDVSGWSRTDEGRAIADRVRADAAAGKPAVEISRRSRRRGPMLLAAAVLALFALGASYAIFVRDPQTTTGTACFERLDQGASFVVITLAEGADPIDACRREWRSAFGASPPPRLAECIVEDAGIAVFPFPPSITAQGACSSIGAAIRAPHDSPGE
jgi:hypothetical protein